MGIRSFFFLITLLALPGCIENAPVHESDTVPCHAYAGSMDLSSAMNGYDVFKANPWNPDGGDPGVRTTIFLHECETAKPAPGFYNFIEVKADHSCSTDFSVETITTFEEYMAAQSSSVSVDKEVSGSVSVDTPWVSVSASYRTSSSDSKEQESLKKFFHEQLGEVSLAQAACYTNDLQLGKFLRPVFHENFIAALKRLNTALSGSTSAQEEEFKSFVGEFGTHYAKQVYYGATLVHSTFYNERSKNSQEAASRKGCAGKASSGCVGAGGGNAIVSVNAEACYAENTEKCEAGATQESTGGTNSVEKTKTLSVGSRPLSQGEWVTSDFTAVPIKRSLKLMSTLFEDDWLSENLAYGFDESLNGVGLRSLFNSLVVKYCTMVLGHDETQCQDYQKGCGINDDCGFRNCRNMPDSEKGYECGSPEAECDKSATTIASCKLTIASPWVINQDTELSNVEIKCTTTGRGCIYIAHGSQLTIMYSFAEGNTEGDENSRFIEMAPTSHLTIGGTEISSFNSGDGNGGAIFAPDENVVVITNSAFQLNKAVGNGGDGGAIYMASKGELTITGTKFVSNEARDHGGALYLTGSQLTIDNTRLETNRAGNGGSAFIYDSMASIKNTMFLSNEAHVGGGLYVARTKQLYFKQKDILVLKDVTFQDNISGVKGGGLRLEYTKAEITQSAFIGNDGGNMGGGMYITGRTDTNLDVNLVTISENSIFYNNVAPKGNGEAIYCEKGKLDIETNTAEKREIFALCTVTFQ